jgi:hypothetical protein
MQPEPNAYTVWLAVVGVVKELVTPLVAVLAYWLYKKLGAIHTLVNGNLHAAQKSVAELRDKLKSNGIDPDA